MPRGEGSGAREQSTKGLGTVARAGRAATPPMELDSELREALRPWIDVDEVGAVGLRTWILSVLPLVPRPNTEVRSPDRDGSHESGEARVSALAMALAECATDRARAHFQASEYFQENRVMARRVRALESMLRTRSVAKGTEAPPPDPESDAAAHRYLPPEHP